MALIIDFVVGYLFGSFPLGYALCLMCGYGDIRKIGSGNIGATNVLRTGNKWLALLTLLFDISKGAIPIFAWVGILSVDFDFTEHDAKISRLRERCFS